MVEPSRQELDEYLWDEQGWDILFFAGHSESKNHKGKIHINQDSTLSIAELRNALKFAIGHGLKLAIFNSCDGLGLTQQLADLQIPQTIVMRHNIPDKVAQEFLKYFLTYAASGEPFYLAMRYARERLQGLEDNYPGVSWLPVVCQNPAEEPTTWLSLCGQTNKFLLSCFLSRYFKNNFKTIFLAIAVFIMLLLVVFKPIYVSTSKYEKFSFKGELNSELFQDKVILIGVDSDSGKVLFLTPLKKSAYCCCIILLLLPLLKLRLISYCL